MRLQGPRVRFSPLSLNVFNLVHGPRFASLAAGESNAVTRQWLWGCPAHKWLANPMPPADVPNEPDHLRQSRRFAKPPFCHNSSVFATFAGFRETPILSQPSFSQSNHYLGRVCPAFRLAKPSPPHLTCLTRNCLASWLAKPLIGQQKRGVNRRYDSRKSVAN